MAEDIIKIGVAMALGYIIADFLSSKIAYQGDVADEEGDISTLGSNVLPAYSPTTPNTPQAKSYQGYVFGQGGGKQRHQWDFMPHSLNPRPFMAYQGGVLCDNGSTPTNGLCSDGSTAYTLACSDQSTPSGGICANGTKAVVSPLSTPPSAPAPTPTVSTTTPTVPTTPLVPTSTDSGIPATPTAPVVTTPPPVTTPTVQPVAVTTTSVPTPVVTPVTPVVAPNPALPTFPQSHDLDHDIQQHVQNAIHRNMHQRGQNWGRNSGWAFHRTLPGRKAYAGTASSTSTTSPTPVGQQGGGAVLLTTVTPQGVHLDAHGLTPLEPITVDLNIPLSKISKTTNLTADVTGHVAHDYNMSKPNPNKSYIAAIRVTGKSSGKSAFKSVKI